MSFDPRFDTVTRLPLSPRQLCRTLQQPSQAATPPNRLLSVT